MCFSYSEFCLSMTGPVSSSVVKASMASIQPDVSGRVEDEEVEVESRPVEKASGQADAVLEHDDVTDDEEWINEDWTLYSIWHSYFDDFPNKLQRRRFSKPKKIFLNEVIPEVEQLFPKFRTVSLQDKKLMVSQRILAQF